MQHFECVRKYLDMTCRMFGMEYDTILKLGMITQGHTACFITTTQLNFVEVLRIPPDSCLEALRGKTPIVKRDTQDPEPSMTVAWALRCLNATTCKGPMLPARI